MDKGLGNWEMATGNWRRQTANDKTVAPRQVKAARACRSPKRLFAVIAVAVNYPCISVHIRVIRGKNAVAVAVIAVAVIIRAYPCYPWQKKRRGRGRYYLRCPFGLIIPSANADLFASSEASRRRRGTEMKGSSILQPVLGLSSTSS